MSDADRQVERLEGGGLMCAEVSPLERRAEDGTSEARRRVKRTNEHRLGMSLLRRQEAEERMREEEGGWDALTQHVELLLHQALMCKNRVDSTQQLTLSPP
ncbi:hypothetical protein CgunFtcFv8_018491 [Champsocephalus gunnari]|uniref:Uncharacterized protein n=1 Tax=Champsocephalus gunnari TaxID=52237 RepID=A0AAN8BSS8_CHAGU|nr:hypothetical protein CgunFtcFv8_018491 [Champsocephalus gunnari]